MVMQKRDANMKGVKIVISVIVLLLILVKSDLPLFGQQADLQTFLRNLKVDDWVKFKGTVQSDTTIILHQIKVIYGEVEADDCEVSGTVGSVVAEEKKIFILFLPVKFDKDTEYEKAFKSFSDIEPGIYVEIEGSFLQDGTFLAAEISTEKPKRDEENMVEWKGKVQSVHPESNSFVILGHTVSLTPETKIKSLIHN
jgi:hypothetical protein